MNIYLGDHFDGFVRKQVESGRYANASEVVRDGLRLLDEEQRHQTLLDAIDVAEAEIARGEAIPYTPDLMDRLSCEARENARLGKPINNALVTPD